MTEAYSKATLITIGTDLETMLSDGFEDQRATVSASKEVVLSLFGELNRAIEKENEEDLNECFAVISDMEQMFEVFKLKAAQENTRVFVPSSSTGSLNDIDNDLFRELEGSTGDLSINDDQTWVSHGISPHYLHPMVRSIARLGSGDGGESHQRISLTFFLASKCTLHKSTISGELSYLVSAFNLARTLEEDMHHFKDDEYAAYNQPQNNPAPTATCASTARQCHFLVHNSILPISTLYSNSQILSHSSSASSYLYANNSLLSKLGIRPQVITTHILSLRCEISLSSSESKYLISFTSITPDAETKAFAGQEDDYSSKSVPLTKENLATHNLTALSSIDIDLGADYVE